MCPKPPADRYRRPSCPDIDWCQGNGCCNWHCLMDEEGTCPDQPPYTEDPVFMRQLAQAKALPPAPICTEATHPHWDFAWCSYCGRTP